MMQRTAYLVVHLDTTISPPIFTGAKVYGEKATSLTGAISHTTFAFDVLEADGEDFEDAIGTLAHYLEMVPWSRAFEWVRPLLDEQSKYDLARCLAKKKGRVA